MNSEGRMISDDCMEEFCLEVLLILALTLRNGMYLSFCRCMVLLRYGSFRIVIVDGYDNHGFYKFRHACLLENLI